MSQKRAQHATLGAVSEQRMTPTLASLREALIMCASHGSAHLPWHRDLPLHALAETAGMLVVEHRCLQVRASEDARPGTLSARFGRGGFPWHTDGAQLGSPPRVSLMRALATSKTPTLIFDLQGHLLSAGRLRRGLCRGVWTVHGGGRPFHAPVVGSDGRVRLTQQS